MPRATAFANRKTQSSSIAIGVISSIVIWMLSPGMHLRALRQRNRSRYIRRSEVKPDDSVENGV